MVSTKVRDAGTKSCTKSSVASVLNVLRLIRVLIRVFWMVPFSLFSFMSMTIQIADSESAIAEFQAALDEHFKLKHIGRLHFILGVEVVHGADGRGWRWWGLFRWHGHDVLLAVSSRRLIKNRDLTSWYF